MPNRGLIESLKKTNNVKEFYVHNKEKYYKNYEIPTNNYIDLDTNILSINDCVNKILKNLC